MNSKLFENVDIWTFQNSMLVHPFPVAFSMSRVLGSRTPAELIDATLKTAEVITRYVAGLCVASWAARDDMANGELEAPDGNISFGTFLSVVQHVAAFDAKAHPLGVYLSPIRRSKKGVGVADEALTALLNLRNDLGHELSALNEARAMSVMAEHRPVEHLETAIKTLDGILGFPLFVSEECRYEQGSFTIRRLLLMGHSPHPIPEDLACSSGIDHSHSPYVSVRGKLLVLPPFVQWRLVQQRHNYELLFLDGVKTNDVRYTSMFATDHTEVGTAPLLRSLFDGSHRRPAEQLMLQDGRSMDRAWSEHRQQIRESEKARRGLVPWKRLDNGAVAWLANRLPDPSGTPREHITAVLLDGRVRVTQSEAHQLVVLLGTQQSVVEELGRDMLDVRVLGPDDERPSDRRTLRVNVVEALQEAVTFVADHLNFNDVTVDTFHKQEGSADYLAIREGMVNQFIHQDYGDPRAASQVELRPGRTILFNPGCSLVSSDRLMEGGRSQCRNPLIARALRLIGIAELAGSGIRTVTATWRKANRQAPHFESDDAANSFTVTLTWDSEVGDISTRWQSALGVEISALEASALEFIAEAGSPTRRAIAAVLHATVDEVEPAVQHLLLQGLVLEQEDGRLRPSDGVMSVITSSGS